MAATSSVSLRNNGILLHFFRELQHCLPAPQTQIPSFGKPAKLPSLESHTDVNCNSLGTYTFELSSLIKRMLSFTPLPLHCLLRFLESWTLSHLSLPFFVSFRSWHMVIYRNLRAWGYLLPASFKQMKQSACLLPQMRLALLPCVLIRWLEFISHGRNDLYHLSCRETLGYVSCTSWSRYRELCSSPKSVVSLEVLNFTFLLLYLGDICCLMYDAAIHVAKPLFCKQLIGQF